MSTPLAPTDPDPPQSSSDAPISTDSALPASQRPTRLPPAQSAVPPDEPPTASFVRHPRARNAHSKSITTAVGRDTHGALNQHPAEYGDFSVGVQDAQGARVTMEDAYSFVIDFDGIRGQGFFAIFDGHAGPEAAEWCGNNFHIQFLAALKENPNMAIPEVMNKTFLNVDTHLSSLTTERGSSSGCTAVTAFLRIEDGHGNQSFLHDVSSSTAVASSKSSSDSSEPPSTAEKRHSTLKNSLKSLASSIQRSRSTSPSPFESSTPRPSTPSSHTPVFETTNLTLKRVLYTANAGDARAVLCRSGKALRLTYDHKGADRQEAKRIQDAGGFVLNNRVNGVLAVTRSLGDSSMKDFVVGAPYTTETPLGDSDEFLILACDGLWDVASDQQAVDLVRDIQDVNAAAKKLIDHAFEEGTRDNVTILVVRFKKSGRS